MEGKKMEKEIFKMSESELSDYLDVLITQKLEQAIPSNVSIETVYKDIYKHIRGYNRILQLQLNHIKARADMGKYFMIVMCRAMPKEQSDLIMAEVTKLKDEDNEKTMAKIRKLQEA